MDITKIKYTNKEETELVVYPYGIYVPMHKYGPNKVEIVEHIKLHGIEPYQTDDELTAYLIRNIKSSVQIHLDTKARELGYDDINSVAKYMGYANKYQVEAESLGAWTASVWEYIEDELIKVQAGTRTMPSIDEALLELPTY